MEYPDVIIVVGRDLHRNKYFYEKLSKDVIAFYLNHCVVELIK